MLSSKKVVDHLRMCKSFWQILLSTKSGRQCSAYHIHAGHNKFRTPYECYGGRWKGGGQGMPSIQDDGQKRHGGDKSAEPINKPFISGRSVTIPNPREMDANQGPPPTSHLSIEKIRDSRERIRWNAPAKHDSLQGRGENPVDAAAFSRTILDYPVSQRCPVHHTAHPPT